MASVDRAHAPLTLVAAERCSRSPTTLVTKTITVGEFLSGPNRFLIPAYQRSYVWDRLIALAFYRDLCRAQDRPQHSLGPIMISHGNDAGFWELADGQQRLVTLTLVLAALRDLLPSCNLKNDLQEVLCCKDGEPRVRLRDIDRDGLQILLGSLRGGGLELRESDDSRAAGRLIGVARALKSEIGDAGVQEIQRIVTFILNRCSFLCLSAPDQVPMQVRLKAIHLLCAAKAEISATELGSHLGVQVRAGSFLTAA